MRRLIAALFFASLGGGLVYLAFTHHVVRADEGFLLVPKHTASLTDVWADVRGWTADRWLEHPQLARSLIEQGRSDLIVEPATNRFLRGVWDTFRPSRPEEPAERK
jgi:hypothetical protein